ncbi:MAG: MBL fold metallo-hydrolase, partial [Candidatus Helarchaeota archaeon]
MSSTVPSADKVNIRVLVNNYVDPTLPMEERFQEFVTQPGRSAGTCVGDHGLTLALELVSNGISHKILLDAGGINATVVQNAAAFKVNFTEFEKLILTHGHVDHYGGLFKTMEHIQAIDLIVSPHAFNQKYMLVGDMVGKELLPQEIDLRTLKKQKVIFKLPPFKEKLILRFMEGKAITLNKEITRPTQLFDGCWVSGEIELLDKTEISSGL